MPGLVLDGGMKLQAEFDVFFWEKVSELGFNPDFETGFRFFITGPGFSVLTNGIYEAPVPVASFLSLELDDAALKLCMP